MTLRHHRTIANYITVIKRGISYSTSPHRDLRYVPKYDELHKEDLNQLNDFIDSSKRLFVLTGAGLSTESGIRDYRSEGVGQYAVSDQRPINYQEFLKNPVRRHRYWARNFAAWPIFSSFQPNICHKILADMEKYGNLYWLVTQNVDGLHSKAGSVNLTELHGTTAKVGCLSCSYETSRQEFQEVLSHVNKGWVSNSTGMQAPDGDIVVPEKDADSFKMVDCPSCGGILKPKVIFFGDNVPASVKDFIFEKFSVTDALLVIGSSLHTYSSFRYILAAKERKIPIGIINIGKTRGDDQADLKISVRAGDILPKLKLNWYQEGIS